MLNGLDLFSGIGGITLALDRIVRPIAYCEADKYCQAVLLSRMRDGSIPSAPIWDNVETLQAANLPKEIDIISTGFPCQDISIAGTGKGLEGKRSGLYSHVLRLTCEIQPSFVFLESVPAITLRGLERITMDFVSLGYDFRWTIVSAQEIGAAHIRERWFGVAHSDRLRLWQERRPREQKRQNKRKREVEPDMQSSSRDTSESSSRKIEPRVFRANDGIPHSIHRNRALGNAVVPLQAREAFKRLIGAKDALKKIEEIK